MAGELNTKEETKGQSIDEIRVMKEFDEKAFATSIILSPKTPSEIFKKLKTILKYYGVVPLLNADEWKLTYTIKSKLDSDSITKGIEPEFCEV